MVRLGWFLTVRTFARAGHTQIPTDSMRVPARLPTSVSPSDGTWHRVCPPERAATSEDSPCATSASSKTWEWRTSRSNGGKKASLGELTRALASEGVRVPEGLAVTADGYRPLPGRRGARRTPRCERPQGARSGGEAQPGDLTIGAEHGATRTTRSARLAARRAHRVRLRGGSQARGVGSWLASANTRGWVSRAKSG